jgi:hypothetical protein
MSFSRQMSGRIVDNPAWINTRLSLNTEFRAKCPQLHTTQHLKMFHDGNAVVMMVWI